MKDLKQDGECEYCKGVGCVACDATKTNMPKLTYKQKYLILTEQYNNSIPISKLQELIDNADASLWGFMESIEVLIEEAKGNEQ